MDSTDLIKKGGNLQKTGEVVALVLGIGLFALTIYANMLSIKTNKVFLRKLSDEGYK